MAGGAAPGARWRERAGGDGLRQLPQRRVCLLRKPPGGWRGESSSEAAVSWCSNAAKFTAGAAQQLPCVRSPELHSFTAEWC